MKRRSRRRVYFQKVEMDEETGLYYYGARYLDPKYSRWLSGDPALGDYIPKAPIDDEAKKHNENLPGMGGVYNVVNLHLYHYAGNNPVKYEDPDGRDIKDTNNYRGADINFLTGEEYELASKVKNNDENLFLVIGHVSDRSTHMQGPDRVPILPKELAAKIKSHKNYKQGMTIRLISCFAGRHGKDSFAQAVANSMGKGIKVEAYETVVCIESDGTYYGAEGENGNIFIPDTNKKVDYKIFIGEKNEPR